MATLLILEPIFEADFEDCSYGFSSWPIGLPGAGGDTRACQGRWVYKGLRLDCGYRVDLIVADAVAVELKTVDHLASVAVTKDQ